MNQFTTLVCLLLFTAATALAQVPHKFSYQASVRGENGGVLVN